MLLVEDADERSFALSRSTINVRWYIGLAYSMYVWVYEEMV